MCSPHCPDSNVVVPFPKKQKPCAEADPVHAMLDALREAGSEPGMMSTEQAASDSNRAEDDGNSAPDHADPLIRSDIDIRIGSFQIAFRLRMSVRK